MIKSRAATGWAALLVVAIVASLCAPAFAAPPRKKTPPARRPAKVEDLATTVSRRLSKRLHTPVKIAELGYRIFQSAFVGSGVRIGPAGAPYLKASDIRVELASLSNRREFREIVISGVVARLPARWIGRPIPKAPQKRSVSIRRLVLRKARVLLIDKGKVTGRLAGVRADGKALRFASSAKGKIATLTGGLHIRAKTLTLGDIAITGLDLKAELKGARVKISSLTFEIFGGRVELAGSLKLARVPRLSLRGKATLRPWGKSGSALAGKLSVRSAGKGLNVSGKLRTSGKAKLDATIGSLPTSIPLRLNMRLGRRRLTGTLKKWRLR